MEWLRIIKDHVAVSMHFDCDDKDVVLLPLYG
jgi:hypothetical protein